ncbi:MAG: hypothetical protein M1818_001264 [Claussenomyces sp. TS43310]|nr:MAG: hypothetical protein M1818_001264 [Claussenomyces sp. TS43310]
MTIVLDENENLCYLDAASIRLSEVRITIPSIKEVEHLLRIIKGKRPDLDILNTRRERTFVADNVLGSGSATSEGTDNGNREFQDFHHDEDFVQAEDWIQEIPETPNEYYTLARDLVIVESIDNSVEENISRIEDTYDASPQAIGSPYTEVQSCETASTLSENTEPSVTLDIERDNFHDIANASYHQVSSTERSVPKTSIRRIATQEASVFEVERLESHPISAQQLNEEMTEASATVLKDIPATNYRSFESKLGKNDGIHDEEGPSGGIFRIENQDTSDPGDIVENGSRSSKTQGTNKEDSAQFLASEDQIAILSPKKPSTRKLKSSLKAKPHLVASVSVAMGHDKVKADTQGAPRSSKHIADRKVMIPTSKAMDNPVATVESNFATPKTRQGRQLPRGSGKDARAGSKKDNSCRSKSADSKKRWTAPDKFNGLLPPRRSEIDGLKREEERKRTTFSEETSDDKATVVQRHTKHESPSLMKKQSTREDDLCSKTSVQYRKAKRAETLGDAAVSLQVTNLTPKPRRTRDPDSVAVIEPRMYNLPVLEANTPGSVVRNSTSDSDEAMIQNSISKVITTPAQKSGRYMAGKLSELLDHADYGTPKGKAALVNSLSPLARGIAKLGEQSGDSRNEHIILDSNPGLPVSTQRRQPSRLKHSAACANEDGSQGALEPTTASLMEPGYIQVLKQEGHGSGTSEANKISAVKRDFNLKRRIQEMQPESIRRRLRTCVQDAHSDAVAKIIDWSLVDFQYQPAPIEPLSHAQYDDQPTLRRSPRLLERARKASAAMRQAINIRPSLVDERLARKTPLVGFGREGPRNQGVSKGKPTSMKIPTPGVDTTITEGMIHRGDAVVSTKRKCQHEIGSSADNFSDKIVRKMQKVATDENSGFKSSSHFEEENATRLPFNSPVGPQQLLKKLRRGSHVSHVTENGSPIATARANDGQDYLKIVARTLLGQRVSNESANPRIVPVQVQELNKRGIRRAGGGSDSSSPAISPREIAAAKNTVSYHRYDLRSSNAPTDVTSLEGEVNSARSPHERASDGKSLRFATDELLVPEELLDPFAAEQIGKQPSAFLKQVQSLTRPKVQGYRQGIKEKSIGVEEPERTLGDVGNQPHLDDTTSSSDVTDSRSDNSEQFGDLPATASGHVPAPDEEWRNALRPHQKSVLDSLYQICNDVVRYLIHEEAALEDVVEDYHNRGLGLVKALEQDYQANRNTMQKEISDRRNHVFKRFKNSRRDIARMTKEWKSSSIRDLERNWIAQQEALLEKIRGRDLGKSKGAIVST